MSLLPKRSLFVAFLGLLGLMMISVPTYAQQTATSPNSTEDTASSERAQNAVYIELGGAGLLYSVNYDRHVFGRWHLRAGYSTLGSDFWFGDNGRTHLVPLQFVFVSQTEHAFELGAGLTLVWQSNDPDPLGQPTSDFGAMIPSFTAGYRYQPRDQGFLFRIGFTPFVGYDNTLRILPYGGISFGYAF